MRLSLGFSDDTAWVWRRTIDTQSLLVTTSVRPTEDSPAGTTEEMSVGRVMIPYLHQAIRLSNMDQWARITANKGWDKAQPGRTWTAMLTGTDHPLNLSVPFAPPQWDVMEQALCRLAGSAALAATGTLSLTLSVTETDGPSLEITIAGGKITLAAGAHGTLAHHKEKALRRSDGAKVEELLDKVGAWGWMAYYLDRHGKHAKHWSLNLAKGDVTRHAAGCDRMPEGFAALLDTLTALAME